MYLEREEGRERNIIVWVPLARPLLGTWLATQVCSLTGNGALDPLVHRWALNPLSHTSQGDSWFIKEMNSTGLGNILVVRRGRHCRGPRFLLSSVE